MTRLLAPSPLLRSALPRPSLLLRNPHLLAAVTKPTPPPSRFAPPPPARSIPHTNPPPQPNLQPPPPPPNPPPPPRHLPRPHHDHDHGRDSRHCPQDVHHRAPRAGRRGGADALRAAADHVGRDAADPEEEAWVSEQDSDEEWEEYAQEEDWQGEEEVECLGGAR